MSDIVIIGGGITGAAAALSLAEEGWKVTLIERRGIAAMASGLTLGGVRQSGRHSAELPLARAAVAIWPTLRERLGQDVEYRRLGNLRLARDENEVETIRDMVEEQRSLGLELAFLPSTGAVRDVAPAISEHVLAASFCPSDGHANPVKATRAFAGAAKARGALVREGVEARSIIVEHGRVAGLDTSQGFVPADVAVVAAGVHAPGLLAPLGLHLPLTVMLVQVLQTETLPPLLDQVLGVANADCAGRQEADGRLRVTSGLGAVPAEAGGWTEEALRPGAGDIARLRQRVGQILPKLAEAPLYRAWGGLIDLTPDALPVIDAPQAISGLVVAAGFSGHGFCLGPVSGEIIADLALGRPPRHDIGALRLARFEAQKGLAPAVPSLHG